MRPWRYSLSPHDDFVSVPGHETIQVEDVVETNDRYALVEKIRRVALVTESHQPMIERL